MPCGATGSHPPYTLWPQSREEEEVEEGDWETRGEDGGVGRRRRAEGAKPPDGTVNNSAVGIVVRAALCDGAALSHLHLLPPPPSITHSLSRSLDKSMAFGLFFLFLWRAAVRRPSEDEEVALKPTQSSRKSGGV